MLCLTRKENERIRIMTSDGPVWITVVHINRGRVRIGVEAPLSCEIMREEVLPGLEWYQQPEQQKAV